MDLKSQCDCGPDWIERDGRFLRFWLIAVSITSQRSNIVGAMIVDKTMSLRFQLEYWKDGAWFVGRLPHVPGVFSQGATLEELEENVRDAYRIMYPDSNPNLTVDALQRIS